MTLIKPHFKNPDDYTDIDDLKDYVKHLIEIYNGLIDAYNLLDKKYEYMVNVENRILRDIEEILTEYNRNNE